MTEKDDLEEKTEEESAVKGAEDIFVTDEQAAFLREEHMRRYNRTPLILSLIGLLGCVFYGITLPLSAFAFMMSLARLKRKKSRPLVWAAVVSFVAVVISLIYIVAVVLVYLLS